MNDCPHGLNVKLNSHYAINNIDIYYHLGNGADIVKSLNRSSNNQPVTIGVIVGACVLLTIGVIVLIFFLRYV